MRSAGVTGESSSCVMPRTASLTRISMCSPSSLPCHRAAWSSGYRADSERSTERTVAPSAHGSSSTRWPVPSPPMNFVIHETISTGTVGAVPVELALLIVIALRAAGAAALEDGETLHRGQVLLVGGAGGAVLDVVVEDVHFPLHAVGILHPELVLVGVAAVDAELFAHGQAGGLHTLHLAHDDLLRGDLDAHVIDVAAALGGMGFRHGQVQRAEGGQELDVAGLDLHGGHAEELLVESAALLEVGHGHVHMNLRRFDAHR